MCLSRILIIILSKDVVLNVKTEFHLNVPSAFFGGFFALGSAGTLQNAVTY